MSYSTEGINAHDGSPCARFFREDEFPVQNPTDAAYPPRNRGNGHHDFHDDSQSGFGGNSAPEDEDGLGGFRGLRSAVIIEALALGLVWGVWYCAGLVAAWWRAL